MSLARSPSLVARELPGAFCWTKFGVESGEAVDAILARKEIERNENAGIFLWGVGTSIRPSLQALVDLEPEPAVMFSPMRSRAAPHDVRPDAVVVWRSARGLDGKDYELPNAARVVSRATAGSPRRHHYALVCHSELPLPAGPRTDYGLPWIDDLNVRNLLTGRPVGSSQVTSVVRAISAAGRPRYEVAFRATLREPYFLVLRDPEPVTEG